MSCHSDMFSDRSFVCNNMFSDDYVPNKSFYHRKCATNVSAYLIVVDKDIGRFNSAPGLASTPEDTALPVGEAWSLG